MNEYTPKKQMVYVPLYYDMRDMFAALPADTVKEIVLGMIDYGQGGVMPEFGGDAYKYAIFAAIRNTIDASRKSYAQRCAAQSINAKKGVAKRATASDGMRRLATASDGMPTHAKRAKTIQDNTIQDNTREDNITRESAEHSIFRNRGNPAMLPLADGNEWTLPELMRKELTAAYPAIDIDAELQRMRAWLLADSGRRRDADKMQKFVASWLARTRSGTGKPSFTGMHNNEYDFEELERQLLAAQDTEV